MGLGVRAGAAAARRTARVVRGRQRSVPAASQAATADRSVFFDHSRFPELDCVRSLLPAETLAAAERRAAAIGVSADRVLIAAGSLTEEAYLRALGERLGVPFEPLDDVPRAACLADDAMLTASAASGLLPLSEQDELVVVVAPRGRAVRRLIAMFEVNPPLARRFRFTTAERLNRFVLRYGDKALVARATDHLRQSFPALSAGPRRRRFPVRSSIAALAMLGGAVLAPGIVLHGLPVTLAALFLAWLGLRLAAAFIAPPPRAPTTRPDSDLPDYSIITALYREAASVDGLLRTIERFDYPAEKLDVIVALEADDHETRAAIEKRQGRVPLTIITVPASGPRTKPKALNVALPFARGSFTVVYDAEDRPEPDQLRRALQAFDAGGEKLACAQARLCIDNTADSWLARGILAQTPQAH